MLRSRVSLLGIAAGLVVVGGCSSADFTTGEPALEDTALPDDAIGNEPETALDAAPAPDTYVADTYVGDTFIADTFIADTFIAPDTITVDTWTPPDSLGVDTGPEVVVDTAPPCDPTASPSVDACVLRDDLGIFVSWSKGNDGNPGTKIAPMKTFAGALAAAKLAKKRVYACAETFPEQVSLIDGVNVFGGVDCVAWKKAAGRTVIAPTTAPAVRAKSLSLGAHVESVEARSPNATASGSSSIAMIAEASLNVVLVDVALVAGLGAAGIAGAPGTAGGSGDSGAKGGDYIVNDSCGIYYSSALGGAPGANAKPGGSGASTGCAWYVRSGESAPGSDGVCGKGGSEDPLTKFCTDGKIGCVGSAGAPGAGSTASGTISASGYLPPGAGGDGATAGYGTGGGGGAAGAGKQLGSTSLSGGYSGGAGGGGGGAGHPGTGGKGGTSGGASIALLSLASDVTIGKSLLETKGGGAGGAGGAGGTGGMGGIGGGRGSGKCTGTPPLVSCESQSGCAGGQGGVGGAGGAGGGGAGGPSIAIAYTTKEPVAVSTSFVLGPPGSGGASSGSATSQGAGGVKVERKAF